MNEDVKQRIDKAEKELNEVFYNLMFEHGDNDGHYELDNRESGYHTLLKYARKWQRQETGKERKTKGKEREKEKKTNEEILSKIREMIDAENEKIHELTRVLNQLDDRDEPEKTNKAKRQWMLHYGAWSALEDIYKFANGGQGGQSDGK